MDQEARVRSVAKPWLDSLYRHGCNFVLNGHAHVYLRTKPLAFA